ncbi:hypothetical protein O181_127038 [Austropuccinia psidii MF-1]|uniref:Retrotransposon gag domain-containing protein n=1 Tax=Austropuccinia psidii MF-1 TaxID=1389203 RepID=A0A9Q3KSF9_9BASI|nr:hypothetical protein [Austropuccinia psidii MF-1]
MPVKHSPPAKNTISQRNPAVLTPTERVHIDCTPSVHQLNANLDQGPPPSQRGGIKSQSSRSFSGLLGGYLGMSDGERARGGRMMEQMTQFMGQLTQVVSPRENFKAPAFKTPSMKAPDFFDGTQAHKLRGSIQSCQLILHNDAANSFFYRKKLFETQLFTLFGDPNEVRKSEQELDNLRMKESGHVSLYIAYFRRLMSRVGYWGERAYIHVYRRGLASRLLDHLASYPGSFDTLQELMDITLELDTRYHERQNEKGTHQENKPPTTGSNSSRPPQDSSSKRPHHKKNKKGKQFQASMDKPHSALLNKYNKLISSEKERRIKDGLCTYFGGKHPI